MKYLLVVAILLFGVLFGVMAFWPSHVLMDIWILFMRIGLFTTGWAFIGLAALFLFPGWKKL